jgi:hypothetical protein
MIIAWCSAGKKEKYEKLGALDGREDGGWVVGRSWLLCEESLLFVLGQVAPPQ